MHYQKRGDKPRFCYAFKSCIPQEANHDARPKSDNLIDKQNTAFIGSVDVEGFPNMKAMLAPRRREGIKVFFIT